MPRTTRVCVIATIALTVACTRPEVTADTQPLAPPDLAPSTTVTTQPRTATTIDVDRASIYPVDPFTLEAVPGLDPIPDWRLVLGGHVEQRRLAGAVCR